MKQKYKIETFLARFLANVVDEDVEVLGRELRLGLFGLILVGEFDECIPEITYSPFKFIYLNTSIILLEILKCSKEK